MEALENFDEILKETDAVMVYKNVSFVLFKKFEDLMNRYIMRIRLPVVTSVLRFL